MLAKWYFGRRAHMTSEWKPFLAEANNVALTGAVSVASTTLETLPGDAVLYRIEGDLSGDYFGWSVEGLGDVDGDGVPDFAVGAHQLINLGERPNWDAPPGYVRIVSGKDGQTLHTLRPTGSLKVDNPDDMFGCSLTALGDIDGDGAGDLAVGSFLYDYEDADTSEIDENTGAVFLISGATGDRIALLGGERWGDRYGYTLDRIGDRDGDGKDDLLIGVEKGEPKGAVKNAGRVDILSSATHELLGTANGPGWEARMGHSLSVLGDVDGDGVDDFASGAYMFGAMEKAGQQRGAVGAFSGASGELLIAFEGAATVDNLGSSLATLHGSDAPLLAMGATQAGLEAEFTGQYFGPGYVRIHSIKDGGLRGVIVGEGVGDQFGWSLLNVGDRNDDGVDDLLVGAPASMTFLDEKLDRHGRIYLVSGADGAPLRAYRGQELNDQFGASLALLGDVDGDGISDVAVGAPRNVAGQTAAGYVLVISGRVLTPAG